MSDQLETSPNRTVDALVDGAVRLPDMLRFLDAEYGPRIWRSRGRAVDVLIETVLSQNTADVNSHRAFESLLDRFGSMEGVARADVLDIESAISASGLSRIKSVRIKSMLESLERDNGSLDLSFLSAMEPDAARDYLTGFKGVGLKTASCVLLFSLGLPSLPVDTHVHRVAKRLGLIDRRMTAEAAHAALEAMVAPDDRYRFHLHLIEHGRLVCHARRPACGSCVLNGLCPSAFAV
ncbi:MAG: endonuclease III [Dehalococcoidia bacterium]|nr:endonuclease III [Dehalococcoidia bacterium]